MCRLTVAGAGEARSSVDALKDIDTPIIEDCKAFAKTLQRALLDKLVAAEGRSMS